ncbi:hypothetical protein LCGC14_0946000 [marine sediment metagenome]|uniref:Uncharacterized protein n=1 Tax=marine sediment metagenome TaxID=412755 RepID=A0A0F9NNC7_9ZZZZ
MVEIKFPIRFIPFQTGTSENIGAIYNADDKAIASFVNKPNAKIIINAINAWNRRKAKVNNV